MGMKTLKGSFYETSFILDLYIQLGFVNSAVFSHFMVLRCQARVLVLVNLKIVRATI